MKTRTVQLGNQRLGDARLTRPNLIALGEIMPSKSGSVDPTDFPNEVFDLYSIPAFDNGQPEVLTGREIGSTKQVVQPGDALLSKIVPHIRRCWIAGKDRGRRLIASSEWIVFRSGKAHPDYLRYVLVGDRFHARFMQTVSGVGGSLLRARPGYVAEIKIPLPSLSKQRRIAGVLEQADRLRRTRRYALELSDTFLPAAFLELFGDRTVERGRWPTAKLSELVLDGDKINYGVVQPGADTQDGTPIVRVGDMDDLLTSVPLLKRVSPEIDAQHSASRLNGYEILIACVGATLGKIATVRPTMKRFNIARAVARVPGDWTRINREFLAHYLMTPRVQHFWLNETRTVAQPTLNILQIEQTPVMVPPLPLQKKFAALVDRVERLRAVQRESLRQAEHLFASLLHQAFADEA